MKGELYINKKYKIPASEIQVKAVKSSGPGGQHVNTSSTKIIITWSLEKSRAFPAHVKDRLRVKLSNWIDQSGEIKVYSDKFRSQMRNKEEALRKLKNLLVRGLRTPKKRVKTKVPKAQKKKRLENKRKRSEVKRLRKKEW